MKKLGDLLVENKLITQKQLEEALEVQKKNPEKRLGKILLEQGLVNQQELIHLLGRQLQIPYVELSNYELNEQVMDKIPKELMLKFQLVPLRQSEDSIVIAMADPLDVIAQDEISLLTNKKVIPLLAKAEDIERVVRSIVSEDAAREQQEVFRFADESLTRPELEDKEVAKRLIIQAYRFGATELNIEPRSKDLRVRYRINGVPYDFPPLSKQKQDGLLKTLKAYLNLKEEALPQTGRYFGTIDHHRINMRGFTMPTLFGERISLRFLNLPSSFISFSELGMDEEVRRQCQQILESPYGLFLLAAPADSGRSTTYYALLKEFQRAHKVVFSFEDPVEHVISSIHQVQLRLEAGFDYKKALESTLRQLPDVIFISRIADAEVAQFANQLALSGRLVVGVLHTYDATMAIEKMLDFKIPAHLLASTLLGVLSQRLLRILCPRCRSKAQGENYHPVGCSKCMYTGFRGREPIFELLRVKETIAEKIAQALPAPTLRHAAESAGLVPLAVQAKRLVAEGKTSLSEIRRVLRID